MEHTSEQGCDLCGSRAVRRLFEKDGAPHYGCAGCGFLFSRPKVNANWTRALEDYEPAYLQYLAEGVEDQRNHEALLAWAERFVPLAGRRVLDVGAGSGKFARFLRARGVEVEGVEPARPLYARFLAADSAFHPETLEDYARNSAPEVFDAVFACDVIEHVDRPDRFLADAARLLKPGGMLYVTTPDHRSLFSRATGRRWHHYNRYHLSHLSRRTLRVLAARYELRETDFRHLPRWFSVGYLLRYVREFVLGGGRMHPPAVLDRLMFPLNLYDIMCVALRREPGLISASGSTDRGAR